MNTNMSNPFTCLGRASRAAWDRLGTVSREAWACSARAWRRRVLPALFAGLSLIAAGRGVAQTYFNKDGADPYAGLILSGNKLYGTALYGGSSDAGTVFALNTDGTGFTTLHSFNGNDGMNPQAGLTNWGNTLYGTAGCGGPSGNGSVFKVNTDGTSFTTVYSFSATSGSLSTNLDGADPYGGLMMSGNTLYGTTQEGGSAGFGTVFAVNTDGTGFTNLHSFTGGSDGAEPQAGLIILGNTLYGTAYAGGSASNGTVFAVNTDGTDFMLLHTFTALENDTNSDGAVPYAGLVLSGNTLYGTAYAGGTAGNGTVFAVNTDGTDFTVLHSFTAISFPGTNTDGTYPYAGLTLSGNTLYGTTFFGGSGGMGTVFALTTDGTDFITLHNFTATSGSLGFVGTNADGAMLYGGLVLSEDGNTLYGTASSGGRFGLGTVFAVNTDGSAFTTLHDFTTLSLLLPQLTINLSSTNVVLQWPASFDTPRSIYLLQSTTNLVSAAVWAPVFPEPFLVNGQRIVTGPISGAPQFYRLIRQTVGCTGDFDCPPGYRCVDGFPGPNYCAPQLCNGDFDCPPGYICVNGFPGPNYCVPQPCNGNFDCPPGYRCVNGYPYGHCELDHGGGCNCPCGSCVCFGGFCYCAAHGFGCGGGAAALLPRESQRVMKTTLSRIHASAL